MSLLEKMLKLLTTAYSKRDIYNVKKGLPLETEIGKLFSILCWGLDHIEDTSLCVRQWANIEYAKGAVLDRYGKNYGVERAGSDDMFYRLMIKVKMMAQLSGGDIDTVINAVSVLYDIAAEHMELEEVFPAKVRVFVENGLVTEEKREVAGLIGKMAKRIVAAGVGFDIIFRIPHSTNAKVYAMAISHRRAIHRVPVPFPEAKNPSQEIAVGAVAYCRSNHAVSLPYPDAQHPSFQISIGATAMHRSCRYISTQMPVPEPVYSNIYVSGLVFTRISRLSEGVIHDG